MKILRYLLWLSAAGLLALVLLAVGLYLWLDEARLRDYAGEQLSRLLDRPLALEGPLELTFRPLPRLKIQDLRLANPDWAPSRDFLRVPVLEAWLDPAALLERRFRITRLRLERPSLHLEPSPSGEWNWPRLAPGSGAGGRPAVNLEQLVVDDGRVALYPPGQEAPAVQMHLAGTVDDPLALDGVDLAIMVEGRATALDAWLDTPLSPSLPDDMALQGRLRRQGTLWRLEALDARMGEIRLEGHLALDWREPRPHLTGELTGETLDLRPLLDGAKGNGGGAPDLTPLAALDAGLTLRAATVLLPDLAFQGLDISLNLDGGRWVILPVSPVSEPMVK